MPGEKSLQKWGIFSCKKHPMLYSLYASFADWNGVTQPIFAGIKNYVQMFTADELFWKSVINTLYFTLVSVPLNMIVTVVLAVLLNKRLPGFYFFRAVFYLPSIIAGVAIYIAWSYLLNADTGIINYMLSKIGLNGVGWLSDPKYSMLSIILISITSCGGQMLIVLAGLQDIPKEYYEAALIDGAGSIRRFFNVTFPLLTHVIFFNMLMNIIAGLQIYTLPWIMTQGGPLYSTYVYGIHLYNNAFRYYNFGYSSALAWMLFIIILLISLIVFATSKFWVYYREDT